MCVDSAHNTIIIQKRGFLAVCTGTWMRGRTNNIYYKTMFNGVDEWNGRVRLCII